MNYIVIPEGIAASAEGKPLPIPSFVYRQVLDYLLGIVKEGDIVYLAPANDFGCGEYEQETARDYLMERDKNLSIICPVFKIKRYIDTCGNALYLKLFLAEEINNKVFVLVSANIHSYRAEYCFKRSGFKISDIYRIKYLVTNEHVVRRLWYYKYKPVHIIYEGLAIIRELIKPLKEVYSV